MKEGNLLSVRYIHEICNEILKNGVVIWGRLYWCKRGTRFDNCNYRPTLAMLMKIGILSRKEFQRGAPGISYYPKAWFRTGTSPQTSVRTYIYRVQDMARLDQAAKDIREAEVLLEEAQDFEALQRVKSMIARDPNPHLRCKRVVSSLRTSMGWAVKKQREVSH